MNQFIRLIGYTLFGFFILLALAVGVMESALGGHIAKHFLEQALQNSGLQIEVGSLSGRLPQEAFLKQVQIKSLAGQEITIDEMHIQWSILRLIKQELYIDSLTADGVHVSQATPGENLTFSNNKLPFSLQVRSFILTHVTIPEALSIKGRLKIKKGNRDLFLKAFVTRPEFPDAKAELLVFQRPGGEQEVHLKARSPSIAAVRPWVKLEAEGPFQLSFYAKGKPDSFTGKFDGAFQAESLPFPSPLDKIAERDWVFRGKVLKKRNGPLQLKNLLASSSHLRLKGSVDLDDQFKLATGRIHLQTDLDTLPNSPLKGRLSASAQIQQEQGALLIDGNWRVPTLEYGRFKVDQANGAFDGKVDHKALFGTVSATGRFLSESWTIDTPITYRANGPLQLEKISIESPLLHLTGDLVYRPDGFFVGKVDSEKLNLQLIQRLYPSIPLYGQTTAHGTLEVVGEETPIQALHAQIDAKEIYLDSAYAKEASLSLDWREDIKGSIYLELTDAKYEQLILDTAIFDTKSAENNWPFHLSVDGTLIDPLKGVLDGTWQYQKGQFTLSLQSGSGELLKYPIALMNPATIQWQKDLFICKNLRTSVGLSELFFDFEGQPYHTDAKLILDRVPLDFLSINPLDVDVTGTVSLDASLQERGSQVNGELHALIDSLEVKVLGEPEPLYAHGAFQGHFSRERLELKGGLEVREAPLLTLDIDFPIHLQVWPFEASLILNKRASGHLAMQGRIEDFLDFFNLGTHHLEGECTCDLTLRNTLGSPRLEGYIEFENGYYQNYISGTELINLRADVLAEQDKLYLRSLTGQDAKRKGKLHATGELSLAADDRFPFDFDVDFQRLNVVQLDFVSAEAEGKVRLVGNLDSALATGSVKIIETDMTIPDRLPRQLPNLQVVYKNAPKPVHYTPPHLISPYPLNLDLKVHAPDGIFIGGRGLQSEWKGDFHLGGTYTSIAPKGKLELVTGEFVFAGRTFKLTDGAVSFTGKELQMPHLDISANLAEKGVSITARLRGPINQPQVTFQSIPPLPLSGILSYLLFGQDLSDIDGFQALQIASTVAALSGEGPDILESTRKSLGVDRLRIITTPSGDDEGNDTIALQVGKYVAKGVIVSLSQGTEDSSTNISIEVDIGAGFYFQAESEQQQEQGKFTLKWNRNY